MNRTDKLIDASSYGREFFEDADFSVYYPFYTTLAEILNKLCAPKTVLDIGCGLGWQVKAFVDMGIEAYGVDMSQYALRNSPTEIRGRLSEVNIETQTLPFGDEFFDLQTSNGVFEHLRNPSLVISEVARTTKRGGFIFVSVPSPLTNRLNELYRFYREPTHVGVRSRTNWIRLFQEQDLNYVGKLDITNAFRAFRHRHMLTRLLIRSPLFPVYAKLPLNLVFRRGHCGVNSSLGHYAKRDAT